MGAVRPVILRRLPRHARLFDLAAASPLIIFLVFVIAGLALKIHSEIAASPYSSQLALSVATKTVGAIFAATQVALFFARKVPIAKFDAWWPRFIAVIGGNSPLLFLMLPDVARGTSAGLISSVVLVVGTVGSIFVLCRLGRAFSVTPQARALVVAGPYRFIRHPLFVSEQVIIFGIMIQYEQPWAFVIFAASALAQFPRMHYEELILSQAFPEYGAYVARTARLVPGIY